MADNDFFIFLTVDIDQDFASDSTGIMNRNGVEFEGFELGLPLFIESIDQRPFSVFVRADNQIKTLYGDSCYLIEKYSDIIKLIHNSNGELNWHIHLYELRDTNWHPVREENKTVEIYLENFEDVQKKDGLNTDIARIGECVMNNKLIEALDRTGIIIDSTALPGRYRDDFERRFDWTITGNSPFQPSIRDYRSKGVEHYSLWELPMTTIPMKAEYDKSPLKRYVNLSYRTEAFRSYLKDFVRKNRFIVTMLHPHEIIPGKTHKLIGYEPGFVKKNLKLLLNSVYESGKNPVFLKVSQLRDPGNIKKLL